MGIVRLRRRYNPETREMEDVPLDAPDIPRTAYVIGDIPDYQSPIDGRVVSGRRQRREDLLRTNSRPWEGFDAERREAARQQAYAEERRDRRLDERVREAYHQRLTPQQRREIEGR